jgi:hypothetical protein
MKDFVEKWIGCDYIFLDSVEGIGSKFDVCIMPNSAMRVPELIAMIDFNIPVRIGQVGKEHTKYSYLFNVIVPVSNYDNEQKSFIDLGNVIRQVI